MNWHQVVSGMALWGLGAHLAQTIPTPSNPWACWLIGGLQYLFANYDKGRAALDK